MGDIELLLKKSYESLPGYRKDILDNNGNAVLTVELYCKCLNNGEPLVISENGGEYCIVLMLGYPVGATHSELGDVGFGVCEKILVGDLNTFWRGFVNAFEHSWSNGEVFRDFDSCTDLVVKAASFNFSGN